MLSAKHHGNGARRFKHGSAHGQKEVVQRPADTALEDALLSFTFSRQMEMRTSYCEKIEKKFNFFNYSDLFFQCFLHPVGRKVSVLSVLQADGRQKFVVAFFHSILSFIQ